MKSFLGRLLLGCAIAVGVAHAQITTNPAVTGIGADLSGGSISGVLPAAKGGTGLSALGTGIANALGTNVGSAGAPVLFNGAGGTPSSLTLTNATGLPVAGGGTAATTARGAAANLSAPHILYKNFVQVLTPSDNAENTLFSYTLPGNSMGANGAIRITVFTATGSSSFSKNIKVYFGGLSGTDYAVGFGVTTPTNSMLRTTIGNRNATNSQYGMTEVGAAAGSTIRTPTTSSRDTTASQEILVTCTKVTSASADACTGNGIIIELLSSGS